MTKAKNAKNQLALLLVAMVSLTLVVPAHAQETIVYDKIASFPVTDNAKNKISALTGMVQTFMYCFDSISQDYIITGGGIDANYGMQTGNAVAHYQTYWNLTVDGSTGPQTWGKISSALTYDKNQYDPNGFYFRGMYGEVANNYLTKYIIYAERNANVLTYYYMVNNYTPSSLSYTP